MKRFLKWTVLAYIVIAIAITLKIVLDRPIVFEINRLWTALIILGIGSILLGTIFVFIEKVYIPNRKKKLTRKIIKLFKAKTVRPLLFHFSINSYDCYIAVEQTLRMSVYGGYIEQIIFYIPQKQLDSLSVKPDFKYELVIIANEFYGYRIHIATSYDLKKSKEKVEQKIRSIRR